MADQPAALPNSLAECHALLRTQQATIEQQQEALDQQQELLREVKREIGLLKRSLFGNRRERFEDPDQQLLFPSNELEDGDDSKEENSNDSDEKKEKDDSENENNNDSSSSRKGRKRRVLPQFLPRERRVQKLDDADLPENMQNVRRFEKKVGEWIEWVPPEIRVIEEFVEMLAIDNEDATETEMLSASREPRILSCFAGPSLLASIGVSRFADHQPYYRLEEILARTGITIDRATQCRWMISLAFVIAPLVERMRQLALGGTVALADETPVKLLVPGRGAAATSYLWAVLGTGAHPYTTFHFTADRSRAGPEQFFAKFRGVLVCDAYSVYESLSKESRDRLRLAGCHVQTA